MVDTRKIRTLVRRTDGRIKRVEDPIAQKLIDSGHYYCKDTDIPVLPAPKTTLGLLENITAVTVNYRTEDLIRRAAVEFRRFYPEIPLIIVDGSAYDPSSDWIYRFAKRDKNTTCLFNTMNLHHGPSLHAGILLARTDIVFTFDSDTVITKEGLLESMHAQIPQGEWYGIAVVDPVTRDGWDMPNGEISYINPRCALINKKTYLKFKPFIKHGAPCIDAMADLHGQGKDHLLINFNYWPYIHHEFCGTVKRTGGYHL